MPTKRAPSLKSVVGEQTYAVWVDMLKRLVPDGRTHRLAPMIAGMLSYAYLVASDMDNEEAEKDSAATILLESEELGDPDDAPELLGLVKQLFQDAKVKPGRVNSRGEDYSVAESAVAEFLHWTDMPWEW